MFGIAAAAALAAQSLAAAPQDDPDLRCMAAFLVVAGQIDDDAAAAPADKDGVNALVMYFFGKVYARVPSLDVRAAIHKLIGSPAYLENDAARDITRCSAEVMERGKTLQAFAADLENGPDEAGEPVD